MYIHKDFEPFALPYIQALNNATFQQDNARSQDTKATFLQEGNINSKESLKKRSITYFFRYINDKKFILEIKDMLSDKLYYRSTEIEKNVVLFADDLLKKYKLFPKFVRQNKDDGLSTKYRQEGNEAFKKTDYLAACKLYTKSIAHAKTNGECLGLAYANRSAVFYQKKMYKQCLEDITEAFEHNNPKNLEYKLIQRQRKANLFLSTQPTFKYYETAPSLSRPSQTIQCASACIEIRRSTVLGRQIVALDQIKVGDVIAVEKPYACLLTKKNLCTHCSFCLESCYNMLPCESCVYAMFCSLQCREAAWTQYHRFECPILANLYDLDANESMLFAFKIAIMAKEHYRKLDRYESKINDTYKSQHYEEIHILKTNTHLRGSDDLFVKAIVVAVVRNLVTDGSSFYQHLEDPKRDKGIFDELMMRHFDTSWMNFHGIYEYAEEDSFVCHSIVGSGAYAFLSLLNHSCCPNIMRHHHGSEIVIRAIRPIAKGDELLDNYGYHFALTEKTERQRKLREKYFFDCTCEACEHNWPLYENMAHGRSIDISEVLLSVRNDREKAAIVINGYLDDYNNIPEEQFHSHNKFIYEMEETMKKCYSILGNRRPEF